MRRLRVSQQTGNIFPLPVSEAVGEVQAPRGLWKARWCLLRLASGSVDAQPSRLLVCPPQRPLGREDLVNQVRIADNWG